MSDSKKYQSNDLIYIFSQISHQLLTYSFFYLIIFNGLTKDNADGFYSASWLFFIIISIVFVSLIVSYSIGLFNFFKKMFKYKISFMECLHANLYKKEEKYSLLNIDSLMTLGLTMAFSTFFVIPELRNIGFVHPSVICAIAGIGMLSGCASLLLSFIVYKGYVKSNQQKVQ